MTNIFNLLMVFSLLNAEFTSCNGQEPNFIDKLLSDFSDNSFYLKLNVSIENSTKLVIIENDDFYLFVKSKKNLDKVEYKKYALNVLAQKEIIELTTYESTKWGFVLPQQNSELENKKNEGKNEFLEFYFNSNKVIKDGFEQTTQYKIIEVLFDWQLACKFDDETGYLLYKQFNK